MLTAFLCEDEQPARNRIKKLLLPYSSEIQLLGEADCAKEAIALIEELRPAVLFLDIQLPDMTGFELLANLTYQPMVIFTTAYEAYAIKAFETYSVDYLVKPFDAARFKMAMDKLKKFSNSSPQQVSYKELEFLLLEKTKKKESFSLPIKTGDRIILLPYEDIVYLKAEDKYTNVIEKNGKLHLTERSLKQLEEQLPVNFLRVHRSYVVNKAEILEIRKYFKGKLLLTMSDKEATTITTGTSYSAEVKKALGI